MKRFALIVAVVVALAGCQQAPTNRRLASQMHAQGAKPAVPEDPEMAELTAMLGRGNLPVGQMAPAAVINVRQHSFQTVGRDTDPAVDRTGRRMVYASTSHSRRSDIFIKDVDGQAVTQLTTDPASDLQPSLSPDGNLVGFTSNRSGAWEVYIISMDGRSIRQVTNGGGDNMHPSWSPDGTRLAYCCRSDRTGQWEIWIVHLLTPGTRQFIGNGLFPVWSPTDDLIAFQRPRERGMQLYGIWTVRLTNGEPSLPTLVAGAPDTAYLCPAFSADGSQLAFAAVTPESGEDAADIYCVDTNGDNFQRLTRGPGRKFSPSWAGDRIYFSFNRGGQENIWSVQVEVGPKVIASTPRRSPAAVAVEGAPGGQ